MLLHAGLALVFAPVYASGAANLPPPTPLCANPLEAEHPRGRLPSPAGATLHDGVHAFWPPSDSLALNFTAVKGRFYSLDVRSVTQQEVEVSTSLSYNATGVLGATFTRSQEVFSWTLDAGGGVAFTFGASVDGWHQLNVTTLGSHPANLWVVLRDEGSTHPAASPVEGSPLLQEVDWYGPGGAAGGYEARDYYVDFRADAQYEVAVSRVLMLSDLSQKPRARVEVQHVEELGKPAYLLFDDKLPDYEATSSGLLDWSVLNYQPTMEKVTFGVARAGRYKVRVSVDANGSAAVHLHVAVRDLGDLGGGDEDFPDLPPGAAGDVNWTLAPGDVLEYHVEEGPAQYLATAVVQGTRVDYDPGRVHLPDVTPYSWVTATTTVLLDDPGDRDWYNSSGLAPANSTSAVLGRANEPRAITGRPGVVEWCVPADVVNNASLLARCALWDDLLEDWALGQPTREQYGDRWFNVTFGDHRSIYARYRADGLLEEFRSVNASGGSFRLELSRVTFVPRPEPPLTVTDLLLRGAPYLVTGAGVTFLAVGVPRALKSRKKLREFTGY
ncbi:MAG: hypothetical protein Kow0069_04320 [Promethearchaeota archaeon]